MSKLKIFGIVCIAFIVLAAIAGFIFYFFYLKPLLDIKPAINQLKSTEYFDQSMIDTLSKYGNKMMKNQTSLSIAIIDNGHVYYYGVERKNDTFSTISNSRYCYQIGSISKVFTSTILAELVVNKEINLDNSIDDYIGFHLNKNLKLTWKELSNHTSGLPSLPNENLIASLSDADNPYVKYDTKWLDSYLKNNIEQDASLNKKHSYSNLGVAVLGNSMGYFKKQSFESLCSQYIFSKYQMNNTFFYEPKHKEKVIPSYDIDGSLATIWELKAFNPAGGIVSNVEDMSQFILAQLDSNNRVMQLTQTPTLINSEKESVGLGWFILKSKLNHKVLFHNGSTINYTSSLSIDLDSRKAIVILSNVNHILTKNNFDALNFALLKYINTAKN
ncbi:MAG: beta-lactamase family protein [Chitinophagales bacterium]|nr:beta-lactamase family protein [Chitinophagales bacterium]